MSSRFAALRERAEGGPETAARDRWITGAGLLLLAGLSWIYIVGLNKGGWPSLMAMPMRHGWTGSDLLLTYLMWLVMMIAMMTPAVAPTILLSPRSSAVRPAEAEPACRLALLLGYLVVWAGACVVATLLQYGLHEAGSSTRDRARCARSWRAPR